MSFAVQHRVARLRGPTGVPPRVQDVQPGRDGPVPAGSLGCRGSSSRASASSGRTAAACGSGAVQQVAHRGHDHEQRRSAVSARHVPALGRVVDRSADEVEQRVEQPLAGAAGVRLPPVGLRLGGEHVAEPLTRQRVGVPVQSRLGPDLHDRQLARLARIGEVGVGHVRRERGDELVHLGPQVRDVHESGQGEQGLRRRHVLQAARQRGERLGHEAGGSEFDAATCQALEQPGDEAETAGQGGIAARLGDRQPAVSTSRSAVDLQPAARASPSCSAACRACR